MKKAIQQGQILLPIRKAIFQFHGTRLQDPDIGQFPSGGIHLNQNAVEWSEGAGAVYTRILLLRPAGGAILPARQTLQGYVSWSGRGLRGKVDLIAELG